MTPSPPHERHEPRRPQDDWDVIDRLTRRCGRAALIGIPTWLVLLAVLNEQITGIPSLAGFTIASVLALVVVVVADVARRDGERGTGLGTFGRLTIVWVAVFTMLALIVARSGNTGVAAVLLPFVAASLATGFAAFILWIRRSGGPPPPRRDGD